MTCPGRGISQPFNVKGFDAGNLAALGAAEEFSAGAYQKFCVNDRIS